MKQVKQDLYQIFDIGKENHQSCMIEDIKCYP